MELGTLTLPFALAETCRVVRGSVPLWAYHRARLRAGGCSEQLLAEVELALATTIERAGAAPRTARLRAHLEVGAGGSVSIELEQRLSSLDVVNGPVLVEVSVAELPPAPALPRGAAKPADRSWWDAAARIARERGGHQALIVDSDGLAVDGSSATVWAVVGGTLVTPPAPSAVAGVARAFLLATAAESGLLIDIRPLAAEEIGCAVEVFLTNAFGGAVAVRGRGGPATERVRALFGEVWAAAE